MPHRATPSAPRSATESGSPRSQPPVGRALCSSQEMWRIPWLQAPPVWAPHPHSSPRSRRFAKLARRSERWGELGSSRNPVTVSQPAHTQGGGGPVGMAPRGTPSLGDSAAWAAAACWALSSPPAQELGCQLVACPFPWGRHTAGPPTGLSRHRRPETRGGGPASCARRKLSQRNGERSTKDSPRQVTMCTLM